MRLTLPTACPASGPFTDLLLQPLTPGRWRLAHTFMYNVAELVESSGCGLVVVPEGFETDLDSVPRLPLVHLLIKGRTVRAAVVHDWLYKRAQRWRGGDAVTRAEADRIFLAAMRDECVAWHYRRAIYAAVRIFGGAAWRRARNAGDAQ